MFKNLKIGDVVAKVTPNGAGKRVKVTRVGNKWFEVEGEEALFSIEDGSEKTKCQCVSSSKRIMYTADFEGQAILEKATQLLSDFGVKVDKAIRIKGTLEYGAERDSFIVTLYARLKKIYGLKDITVDIS